MYYIAYNDHGKLISDFNIDKEIDTLIAKHNSGRNLRYNTSSSLFIHAFRVRIAKGEVKCKDVTFVHGYMTHGILLYPDKTGRIDNWPDGFADKWEKYLEDILYVQVEEAEIYR